MATFAASPKKGKIFKNAHYIRRTYGITMSDALKVAWMVGKSNNSRYSSSKKKTIAVSNMHYKYIVNAAKDIGISVLELING